MFLKQLNHLIQSISLAARAGVQNRRTGKVRRQLADRRQDARQGEGMKRRTHVERRH